MNSEKKGYTATLTLTLQLRKGTEKQASRQHKDQHEQQIGTQEILKKHPKRSVPACIYLNKEIEKHYYKIASQS